MAALSRRRPPPLLMYAQRPARKPPGRSGVQRDIRSAARFVLEEARRRRKPCAPARFGSARSSSRRARPGAGTARGAASTLALRVEHVGGQDEVERAARDERVAVLGPVTCATSPSTSLIASTCAANATASVAPSVASTCAPARAATTLGSASPQPSSSTFVPGAGGSS